MSHPLNIVIMAGQSNMVGYRTTPEMLAPKWRGPLKNTHIWTKQGWIPLAVGAADQRSAFGPEIGFAARYAQSADGPLGIIKVAQNGSYLSTDWSAELEGRLFDHLVTTVLAATRGRDCRLAGFVWMQGEADSIHEADAAAYANRFSRLIAALRLRLASPTLPVVAGIVSPPAESCPYGDIVRTAQKTCAAPHYATVETQGLPLLRDRLHLDGRGIGLLGRKFADALHALQQADATRPPVRHLIWASDTYQCWYEGPASPSHVTVLFPFAVEGNGYEDYGFGQLTFQKKGMPHVVIRSRHSRWFQDAEVFDMARAIRATLGAKANIVAYGASMGAYGALLLSGTLQAKRVIAIAPQYSIDRQHVAGETRWKRAIRAIGRFIHRLDDHVAPDIPKYVFYDAMSPDRMQIAAMPHDASWHFVNLPFASHQVLRFLKECNALPLLLDSMAENGPDLRAIRARVRAGRAASPVYWQSLTLALVGRNRDVARRALDRFRRLDGAPKKVQALERMLAQPAPQNPVATPAE